MQPRSSDLIAVEARLAREVVEHKAAIRRHREQLQQAAEALVEIRRRCAELGIGLTVVAPRREALRS